MNTDSVINTSLNSFINKLQTLEIDADDQVKIVKLFRQKKIIRIGDSSYYWNGDLTGTKTTITIIERPILTD